MRLSWKIRDWLADRHPVFNPPSRYRRVQRVSVISFVDRALLLGLAGGLLFYSLIALLFAGFVAVAMVMTVFS